MEVVKKKFCLHRDSSRDSSIVPACSPVIILSMVSDARLPVDAGYTSHRNGAMRRDGPCPSIHTTQLRNARRELLLYFNAGTYKQCELPGGAVQTDRLNDRPIDRNRLFTARETRYEAASCSTSARVAAGAIHHTTMRPRVQGN